MIKLCAFADEAAENLEGQISALNKNRIGYIELRSISGKNVADFMPSGIRKEADGRRNCRMVDRFAFGKGGYRRVFFRVFGKGKEGM